MNHRCTEAAWVWGLNRQWYRARSAAKWCRVWPSGIEYSQQPSTRPLETGFKYIPSIPQALKPRPKIASDNNYALIYVMVNEGSVTD